MRILILDEDTKQMPHVCDLLRQHGHEVAQVVDWKDLERRIREYGPEGIVIDLMIPAIDLPLEDCRGGYTTGVYLYEHIVHKHAPGVPFVVYSATDLEVSFIKKEVGLLEKYAEFRGILEKGCDEELIVERLESTRGG